MFVMLIKIIFDIFILVVIVDVAMSYFVSPYHPVRKVLDGIVQPLLRPIQRILPSIANINFSPVVLILALQLLQYILIRLFSSGG